MQRTENPLMGLFLQNGGLQKICNDNWEKQKQKHFKQPLWYLRLIEIAVRSGCMRQEEDSHSQLIRVSIERWIKSSCYIYIYICITAFIDTNLNPRQMFWGSRYDIEIGLGMSVCTLFIDTMQSCSTWKSKHCIWRRTCDHPLSFSLNHWFHGCQRYAAVPS